MKHAPSLVVLSLLPLLSACPAPPPRHATFPSDREVDVAVGMLAAIPDGHGENHGATAPPRYPPVAARCEDESACETFVSQGRAWIAGKREGETAVNIDFAVGPDQPPRTHRIVVMIRRHELQEFAPGQPMPGTGILEAQGPDGSRVAHACSRLSPQKEVEMRLDRGDVVRGEGRVYRCAAPVRLPSGNSYLVLLPHEMAGVPASGWSWPMPHPAQDWLYVCAHTPTRSLTPSALWIYRGAGASHADEKLSLVEQRGEAKDVCRPRPNP